MLRQVVVVAAVIAGAAGFFGWRARAGVARPHYAVLVDRSQSSFVSCAGLEAATARILGSRDVQRGSSMTLLATGDRSTADEPRFVWSGAIPVNGRVFEGMTRRMDDRRRFIDGIAEQCRKISPASSSPIFLGVKRALEQLRSLGCGRDSRCGLYVLSDGLETADPLVRRAIASGARAAVVPLALPNAGVRILFCGVAETQAATTRASVAGVRAPEHADRLRAVWGAIFSDAEVVTFQPFCRGAEAD